MINQIVLGVKMIKILISCCFAMSLSFANPAPFGLEINKVNYSDVINKYSSVKEVGINKYSDGKMIYIDPNELDFDGLKNTLLIFSKEDILLAVILTLPNNKFDELYQNLKSKYKLVSKEIPFVGNKNAKFVNDSTEITLNSPHMSFDLELTYVDKNLLNLYKKTEKNEKEQSKEKQKSQL